MKLSQFVAMLLLSTVTAFAQPTFPVNGVADKRSTPTAFTNATIIISPTTTVSNATLLVQDGKILAVGTNVAVPKEAQVINCTGKFIYPAFIDAFTDYGVPRVERAPGFNFFAPAQLTNNQKGAFGWNQAIRADIDAGKLFSTDDSRAKNLRDIGFGAVFTHQKDGIARGTGAVVTLAADKENNTILKDKAAAVYSFSKGSSTQSYPSSMMGCIALLKQTYYDAEWYKTNADKEGVNLSLKAFNEAQNLPQIFDIAERGNGDASSKWNALRADRIGDAFGKQYI
ncbi:MAG: amidohydrolase, partial [Bacteroidetes bacterium]